MHLAIKPEDCTIEKTSVIGTTITDICYGGEEFYPNMTFYIVLGLIWYGLAAVILVCLYKKLFGKKSE